MGRMRVVMPGRAAAAATLAAGLVALAWLAAGAGRAQAGDAPGAAGPSASGRVIDEAGRPVAGARVRLYRRDSRWERRNPVVEETTSGPDGGFRLSTPLRRIGPEQSRGLAPYVLVTDAPGKAVGWRTVPEKASTFEGDITLTAPTERTITVVDAAGRPVEGATVAASSVGDPSSPSADFRDTLSLRPEDGPLTAVTGADGRATLAQLPKTSASFVARKPGFAETHAFREQGRIRLTPGATLSGTVTGPDGEALAGIKVVLYTAFMWDFEHAVTDARGRYRFEDLKARGWDMGAWRPGQTADGKYKLWIESDRYAVPTESLALEPGTSPTLDLKPVHAGVIRVTVVEEGTQKRVPGVRIWGFDAETGSSARFNAYTDERGQAKFYATPSKVSLSVAGPPEGVYVKGDFHRSPGLHQSIEFAGGEADIILVIPPISGPLVTISGACTLPDGTPAADAAVNAGAGQFAASGVMSLIHGRRTDRAGRFTLEGVPAGQTLHLYAETKDRALAGTATARVPEKDDPGFRATVKLMPTVAADRVLVGEGGKPLASRKFHISPVVGEQEFPFQRRDVESDAEGRLKADGIVPGLSYRVEEDVPPREGPIVMRKGGRLPWFNEVIVLAPVKER